MDGCLRALVARVTPLAVVLIMVMGLVLTIASIVKKMAWEEATGMCVNNVIIQIKPPGWGAHFAGEYYDGGGLTHCAGFDEGDGVGNGEYLGVGRTDGSGMGRLLKDGYNTNNYSY